MGPAAFFFPLGIARIRRERACPGAWHRACDSPGGYSHYRSEGGDEMSQERDGSRGRPSWMAGVKPGHSLTEVQPLSLLRLESVVKTYRDPMTLRPFTAVEYLELVGSLFGIRAKTRRARAEALLQRLGLSAHARKPLRKFSKGMTQRVGIAQALLNEPNFLVLDEPMSGLDPIGRSDVKQLLREERERGTTILMTSHVLAETESLCDRVAILHAGRVLEVGTVKGLLSSVVEWEIGLESLPADRALALRAQGHRADAVGARWVVRVGSESSLQGILRELVGAGIKIDSVEPRRESLEDHFVRALGASRVGRR